MYCTCNYMIYQQYIELFRENSSRTEIIFKYLQYHYTSILIEFKFKTIHGHPYKNQNKTEIERYFYIFKSYISFQKDFFMAPEINDYLPRHLHCGNIMVKTNHIHCTKRMSCRYINLSILPR